MIYLSVSVRAHQSTVAHLSPLETLLAATRSPRLLALTRGTTLGTFYLRLIASAQLI